MARTLLVAVEEDMEKERAMIREPLKLNIYDLTCMNEYMYWVGLGVYHSAVEAYGSEYAYGAHDYPTSGIFEVQPRHCPGFRFRKSLTLGSVWMGPEKFREFMEDITCEYTGDSYNLLFKNCNHFCDDVCARLLNVRIPGWLNRLAKIGSLFSCFLPRSLQMDGIHSFNYETYKDDREHIQDEIERHLASPLAIMAPKRKHPVTLSALLCGSKDDREHIQDEIGHLASPLTIMAPKRKHLISLSALLCGSKTRMFLRDRKINNPSKLCRERSSKSSDLWENLSKKV